MLVGWLAQLALGMGTRPNGRSLVGQVTPDSVGPLLDGVERGRLDLDAYRGRSTLTFEAQAAEQPVRRELGLTGINDVLDVIEIGLHRYRVELAAGQSVTADIVDYSVRSTGSEAKRLSPRLSERCRVRCCPRTLLPASSRRGE